MKIFCLSVLILIATTQNIVIHQESSSLLTPMPSDDSYQHASIDLLNLIKKPAKEIKETVERMLFSDENPEIKNDKLVKINDLLRQEILHNLSSNQLTQPKKVPERRLQVNPSTLTASQLRSGNDRVSTSSRLTEIQQQERAMQNYKRVHFWLDDVNNKVNDFRSNVNRRLQDMSVGLQRRSLLMGHYNFMGQGIGAPNGESMSDLDPYSHF